MQVAKVIQEDNTMNQQRDTVPRTTKPAIVRPETKIISPDGRQKRIQVNREVAQQLPPPQGLYAMVWHQLCAERGHESEEKNMLSA